MTELVLARLIPYKPGGTPSVLSQGSKNHSTSRKARKPAKITPATVISGMPATFIWAIGEASYSAFFLYGRMIAAIAVPKYIIAIAWVAASVTEIKPPTLYAYNRETITAGITINSMALTGVPVRSSSSATFSGSRRSKAAANTTRVEERNRVPAQPNHQKLMSSMTTIWIRRLFVRKTASMAGLGHTGRGGT